ncbi:MAG: Fe-S cluster assembly protein SufD, partial [Haloplasmataceae bacterium]|nr:Fe-S cluster assembly protein SufD [Haloplasmataceae bacterium]
KKYPKIGKFNLDKFQFDQFNLKNVEEELVSILPNSLKQFVEDEENVVVIKDGNIIYKNLDDVFNKLEIISYKEAVKNKDSKALELFYKQFKIEASNKFLAINHALQNSAILIRIPKNVAIKETLKLHVIGDNSDLVHHTYIVAEQSSEVTVFEKLDNVKTINANVVSEIFVSDNAKVNYIGIDRFCEETLAFIERRGYVQQNGNLVYALGQLNDGNTVSNNIIKLLGKGAQADSRNVLLADRDNIHAITIDIEHLAPHTIGTINNHGIVKDQAHLFIDGIGKINQGMANSNSQQSTHVITLSDDAKVNANPYLIIDEYDVMAGHGASIGKVDEEQLYYLMSRGLTKIDAEKLIILGFLYPIIEMIDSEKIKTSFIQTIERKLTI